MAKDEKSSRKRILALVKDYYSEFKAPKGKFAPGKDRISYAGRVFDEREMQNAVEACLDFWITEGRFCRQFEVEFPKVFGTRFCSLVNSGSSANLAALSALTSPKLGERRLRKGDKVISVAAGFPTTLNPIMQNGLVPRFVDIELGTYNTTPAMVEAAIDEKTRAVMIAHTLGNVYDAEKIAKICKERNLFLIEDACDALGSRLNGKQAGTFGDIATMSFYPAHHMTMGEGGAVLTSDPLLNRIARSFRDWGRDCWCGTGEDNSCGKRFKWQLGKLPFGYDHKYIYSEIGYNLKLTEMQAAIGLAQLGKLPEFIRKRKQNYAFLLSRLQKHADKLVLPRAIPGADISPFGLPLTAKDNAGFTKNQITEYLESRRIATRVLFGGNLTLQPAYANERFEVSGSLENTNKAMNSTFWVGVYPGLSREMLEYMAGAFDDFLSSH